MNIRGKDIGAGHPPYVIAEIGVNHDGSPERAIALTRLAAQAGADAVKLQYFKADLLMSRASSLAAYQAAAGEHDPREMLRRLELPLDAMDAVVDEAHRLGLAAIVTIFSTELVNECSRLAWDAYKSASPDIIHRPLLEAVAALGKPFVVSTGAATLNEVQRAVEWLMPVSIAQRLTLLQCASCYPVPFQYAAFGGITALKNSFPTVPIGYSDHTRESTSIVAAMLMGACVLEKHLTDERTRSGPDHAASATPAILTQYVRFARDYHDRKSFSAYLLPEEKVVLENEEKNPVKRVLDQELDVRRVSRQSIVPRGDLPTALTAGTVLQREHLRFARPGTGIEPHQIDEVIGRELIKDAEPDTPLTWQHLRPAR